MAVPTPNQYWIRPDALTFSLNTPDVDYLRVSVLAGSAIIAYMEGVIDYDPSHNHRKWPIQAADTFLETTEPYYVHAQLTRSESTPTALIVYSLTKRSITGKIIEEDGTETGEEDQDYFYVYLGKISSSIDKNGRKVGRTWIEAYNPGKLDTNQGRAEDMDGHYLSKLFDDTARGVITFENGIRFGNLLLALEGNDTLFLKNILTGEQANFAASGAIATKGIGASSGGGGVVPWSELENSIIPKVTDTYSIGTNANKWKSIYAIEGHINSLVAHALNAESIKLNGKDVATKEYVIAMVAQGGGGGGTGGSSTVSYLPTIEEGKEIGTLIVDGVSYGLFAPSRYSWDDIDDIPNFSKVAFSGSYNDLTDVPTIPSIVGLASEEWVNTQLDDYQKEITSSNKLSYALISGTPTKLSEFTDDVVKGVYQPLITTDKKLDYTLISGVPTSLKNPYSLKFGSKTYDGSSQKEITASDLGALTSHQTIYMLTIQKNGTTVGTFTPNSKDATINIDGVVTLSDEQEITGRKTFKGGVRLNSNTVIRNAQFTGTNASDAVLWKVDNTGNATFVNGVLGGTLSVTKESTFTGETTHNGGIVIPSGKTLKIGNTVIEEKDGGLFVNGDLAASGSIATKGVGSSSGGGNSYGRLDDWANYNPSNGDVLSALLGYGLKYDIATLTSKFGNYFTKNETRNEIVAHLNDFNAEMIVPNYSTKSEVGSLADVVGGIGSRVSTLEGKATTVSFAQTLQSGKQIGVLTIDGKNTTLFAPASYAWGEITSKPTTLAGYGITDALPLSGGTLSKQLTISSGHDTKFILNNTDTDSKYQFISFRQNDTEYGQLGTSGGDNLVWGKEGFWKTIIHSGNYTDYTYSKSQVDTKISSSNVASANMLKFIGYVHPEGFNANTALSGGGFIRNYGSASYWGETMPSGMSYGVVYQLQGDGAGEVLAGQLAWDVNHNGADSTRRLWWRANDNTGFVNAKWHQIAFTDSNVASADKLSDNTAYTVWGQTYFENGKPKNVGGNLILGYKDTLCTTDSNDKRLYTLQLNSGNYLLFGQYTAKEGYDTLIYGNNISLCYGPTGSSSYTGLFLNSSGNVTIGSSDLAGTTAKLYVEGDAKVSNELYATKVNAKTITSSQGLDICGHGDAGGGSRLFLTTGYFRPWSNDADLINLGSSTIRWKSVYSGLGDFSGNVVLTGGGSGASNISYANAALTIGTVNRTGNVGDYYNGIAFNHMYTYNSGTTYQNHAHGWIGLRLHSTPAAELSYLIFATNGDSTNGTSPIERMCITPDGNVQIGAKNNQGYKLYVNGTLASTGAITIANTLYGIGVTGVIRGSKLVSEGAIETSTLKVGGILIEDKDGDLFVNGNLAASGSVATKGIDTSSSGGSGTIPWSELKNSLIAASTSYNLGSSAKPWGSVYANSIYMNNALVATETWVNNKLGAAASYGIGYVQSGNNGLVTGNSVYVAITSYDSDVLASKYATLANTYTKTQVNNTFAVKSEAMIEYSVSVTGDGNVAPSLNLDCGNGVWSLRNAFNGTNGDLKFLFSEQQRAQLTPAGDLTISGRLTQSSDETLKNILGYNVDMKVRDIANAPICYFTWKDRVSDRQIGTIAQYWELITPECVVKEKGRMSMDYSTLGLVSSIVNAREIVKHDDEIEALKKRVKELEDKLAAVSAA